MELGPLELLIFQGTPFCNINCTYCYLPDRLNTGRISLDVIQETLAHLLNDDLIRGDFTVLWHAGEPLVVPVDFYEKAFALIRRTIPAQFRVRHSFQTNGILIDRRWCEFFKKNQVELGVSIDGPQFIHDRNRKTRSGEGTFLKAISSVELIKEYEIEFSFISVVTRYSCDYPEEIFGFFKGIGALNLSLNIEEVEGSNTISSFWDRSDSKEKVTQFLKAIYHLNLLNGERMNIREINWAKSRVLHSNLNPEDLQFTQLTGAYRTITVDTNGNFSTFSPELIAQVGTKYGDFILGNVMQHSFAHAASTEKFKWIYSDLMKGLKKCKDQCGYFGMCSGGTPSNKVSEHHTLDASETLHCKLVFQAPIDALMNMIDDENEKDIAIKSNG